MQKPWNISNGCLSLSHFQLNTRVLTLVRKRNDKKTLTKKSFILPSLNQFPKESGEKKLAINFQPHLDTYFRSLAEKLQATRKATSYWKNNNLPEVLQATGKSWKTTGKATITRIGID